MLWLGIGLLVIGLLFLVAWRFRRARVLELGSVSEQWMTEQRRHQPLADTE